tara:strand:+ start:17205 stop:17342 length:138 start_codon:yes stop_codon:yes gene_type:complete
MIRGKCNNIFNISAPNTMPEPKVKKKEGQLIKAIMEENHHVKTII